MVPIYERMVKILYSWALITNLLDHGLNIAGSVAKRQHRPLEIHNVYVCLRGVIVDK